MSGLKIGVACAGVVVVFGAVVALLAYTDAPSATAGDESLGQRAAALEVQGEVARKDVTRRLEAALGDDFGGVWFDPSGTLLHVGVTSPASRADAEELAARAGLAASVIETPVHSTWADLSTTQDRWDRQIADLLVGSEAMTWLDPIRNSVMVELGSAVPTAEREALEREAAGDERVAVTVASRPVLRIEPESRCNTFKPIAAACDPTIVAGVTIFSGETVCTAGPAVLLQDLTKNTTETFLLTAGHCIFEAGGNGSSWFAINQAGKEENEIGKAVEYLKNEAGEADVGVIKVETNYWAAKTLTPVVPTIAPWNVKVEPEPFSVTGVANPTLGANSCVSGQTSGWTCAKVRKVGLTAGTVKELVEMETKVPTKGDSGAPWFSEGSPSTLEGTHAGRNEATNYSVFEPLTYSLAQLKTQLEPLTAANETRDACPMADKKCWAGAESYPATFHGTNEAGKEKFSTEAGSIECASSFHGESTTGLLHPTYTSCKAFGLAATVKTEGCDYQINVKEEVAADEFSALTDVVCGAGSAIKVTVATCEVEVASQSGLGTVKLKNDTAASPKKDITVTPEISGLTYTVTKDGFLCPFAGTGKRTNGTYTSSNPLTVTGQNLVGTKIDIAVE